MKKRRFTENEIALIQSIFGDELPKSILRQYELNLRFRRKMRVAADHVPTRITVYGRKYRSGDYSRTRDAFNFGLMLHEAAHAWQWYHRAEMSGQKGYNYKLSRGCRLSDFGLEQQASIIEDYARVYLFSGHAPPWRTPDTAENRELLKTVVEERFLPEYHKAYEAERKRQLTEAAKGSFNAASSMTAKLDALRDEPGSAFKYDTEVWPGGQGVNFRTNVERDRVRSGDNPMMTIWVTETGSMGLAGEGRSSTEKDILNTVTRKARQKRPTKAAAGPA